MNQAPTLKRRGTPSKTSTPRGQARTGPAPSVEPNNPDVAAAELASEGAQPWVNRRASAQATRAANARQASGRRRFVDPTTCEREYSIAEIEFMLMCGSGTFVVAGCPSRAYP